MLTDSLQKTAFQLHTGPIELAIERTSLKRTSLAVETAETRKDRIAKATSASISVRSACLPNGFNLVLTSVVR